MLAFLGAGLRRNLLVASVMSLAFWAETSSAQSSAGVANEIQIVELQGTVEISPSGATTWALTQTNQTLHSFDRLRTGPNSRVALRWSDQSVVPFGALTELEILPPHSPDADSGLHLIRGIISFFHRDKPGRIRVITRGAVAGVEGTEFIVAVSDTDSLERTTMSVIDGRVSFANEQGTLVLTNGEQAVAEMGKPPIRTAGFMANNLLQWCFYYPAVLDLADLPLADDEQTALSESLTAYRAGDLLQALASYPTGRQPASDAEKVFYSALLLSVGEVARAGANLDLLADKDDSKRISRLAKALRLLIAAVKREPTSPAVEPDSATELLANSYYEQSMAGADALEKALRSAKRAAEKSPEIGFAWARVAELEFSFGRIKDASEALDKSLALSPRNAQALALKGFLLAAKNKYREAISWFDRAIAVDAALGNAWLGRGLCRIHGGESKGGREDLLIAAALEPQRAVLRSYLGKAYASVGDFSHARKEFELANRLDSNDPTSWLYSALLNQENNRINEAIGDLEKSKELNDNRSVYRSQLLLDQDQAVRSVNLAAMYRDAGMFDVSVREASRAVSSDYANYSAHLFLANSYDQLRDRNQGDLRYETAAFSEYLVANLLAPAEAGTLSPAISQQEYSRFFERNRLGVASTTEYLSRGAWEETGAQYGVFQNFSYAVDGYYLSDPGQRINEDVEIRQLTVALKLQLTPQDGVFLRASQYEGEGGDVAQRYDSSTVNPGLRTDEELCPSLTFGYHHEWSPGVRTLFLANWVDDTYKAANPIKIVPFIFSSVGFDPAFRRLNVVEEASISQSVYSTELQQIWRQADHNTVAGVRFQQGEIKSRNLQTDPYPYGANAFEDPALAASQDLKTHSQRLSFYGYHNWQIVESLALVGGLSYDRVTYPDNIGSAPFTDTEETDDQISPKAGLVWTPAPNTTFRAAYTRSLGSASLEQSIRLEPTEVAGFNQAFRSLIPESVAGANGGPTFETYGVSLEQKFGRGTYLGVNGEWLKSKVKRRIGSFYIDDDSEFASADSVREHLDFEEYSLILTADQLIGRQFSVGARYRLTHAELADDFVDFLGLPPGNVDYPLQTSQRSRSLLHQLNLHGIWNHPSGFFAVAEAAFYSQDNRSDNIYTTDTPEDAFWQVNLYAGYRFLQRKAELTLGLLNVGDQDYQLNPLTLYSELPRERTLAVRLRLNF